MQKFIDQVLAHNKIKLTVAYLREKHKHVREPWGEGLTRKRIARLSDCVKFTIIGIFIIAVCMAVLAAYVVKTVIKDNQNGNDKPGPSRSAHAIWQFLQFGWYNARKYNAITKFVKHYLIWCFLDYIVVSISDRKHASTSPNQSSVVKWSITTRWIGSTASVMMKYVSEANIAMV